MSVFCHCPKRPFHVTPPPRHVARPGHDPRWSFSYCNVGIVMSGWLNVSSLTLFWSLHHDLCILLYQMSHGTSWILNSSKFWHYYIRLKLSYRYIQMLSTYAGQLCNMVRVFFCSYVFIPLLVRLGGCGFNSRPLPLQLLIFMFSNNSYARFVQRNIFLLALFIVTHRLYCWRAIYSLLYSAIEGLWEKWQLHCNTQLDALYYIYGGGFTDACRYIDNQAYSVILFNYSYLNFLRW